MIKILTGEQMAKWDRLSIRKHKIPAKRLMQNAAMQCVRELRRLPEFRKSSKILIVSGPGNNGGDGFAMAHLLREEGYRVTSCFLGAADRLSPEARFYYQLVDAAPPKKSTLPLRGGPTERHRSERGGGVPREGRVRGRRGGRILGLSKDADHLRFSRLAKQADFLIDGIFGIGIKRPIRGFAAKVIDILNRSGGFRFAIDMPSGVSATTGEILGSAFRADLTVTFEAPKMGQIAPSAWDYVGRLCVVPIGLRSSERPLTRPTGTLSRKGRGDGEIFWVDAKSIKKNLRPRPKASSKGSAGKVLVVAGSSGMPGAGYLTSIAALRAGAGLVTWALPDEAFRRIDLHYPEVILHPLASSGGQFHPKGLSELLGALPRFQSLAIGPGWGQGDAVQKFLTQLLQKVRIPVVIDADALNLLAKVSRRKIRSAILTPHPKEMSRLSGRSVREILKNRIAIAQGFAKKFKVWLVLKGYRSVIAAPDGRVFINSTGGPNLATAGSGDVLTGILAAFLAQGLDREAAALAGVYLHGLAGDRLAQKHGDRGTLASDVAEILPATLRALMEASL